VEPFLVLALGELSSITWSMPALQEIEYDLADMILQLAI